MIYLIALTRKLNLSIAAIVIALVLVTSTAAFIFLNSSGPKMQLYDPNGDVLLAFGSNYHNTVDMEGASVEKVGNKVNCSVLVKEDHSALNERQTVTWEITLIFENSTEDVVGAYTLQILMNVAGYSGSITDVGTGQTAHCTISRRENLITAIFGLSEGPDSNKVEWSITSTYEAEAEGELVANAFDFLPDEGTCTTVFPS